jgi:hypothetical protein
MMIHLLNVSGPPLTLSMQTHKGKIKRVFKLELDTNINHY